MSHFYTHSPLTLSDMFNHQISSVSCSETAAVYSHGSMLERRQDILQDLGQLEVIRLFCQQTSYP